MKIFNLLFQEKLAQNYLCSRYICLVSNDVLLFIDVSLHHKDYI